MVGTIVGATTVPALAAAPGHLMWRAAARVNQTLAQVRPEGVSVHAYAALLALGGGVTRSQQELARSIGVSRTTIARVATELSAAGLVERVRSTTDRRSYSLTRTPAGKRLLTEAWSPQLEALEKRLGGDLSVRDRRRLATLLGRILGDDLDERTPPRLRKAIGFLITQMHLRMHRIFLAELEPVGIEPRHHGALIALRELGPASQSDLAHALGVTGATVVQMVDDLEQRGLVERRRDDADRRTQIVHLLPRGREVLGVSEKLATSSQRKQLADLDDEEYDELVLLLRRFVESG